MSNSYFHFKQFSIHQSRCAMKVGTDGVLLGALAKAPQGGRILDIGTGTGVVALMLAQRSPARIDAVEIDPGAAGQAEENVRATPWAERIRVICGDFAAFHTSCDRRYDLIVSNPPYFRNSLAPKTAEKALARHASEGFYEELLKGSGKLLASSGKCCFILPPEVSEETERMAEEHGLFPLEGIVIRSVPGRKAFRKLLVLGRVRTGTGGKTRATPRSEQELTLHEKDGSYTSTFRQLLQPYYLNL